jgi:GxxExxY protein
MKVHTVLGPGLLESAYHACLVHELRKQNLKVASQVGLPVIYEGERLDLGYRIDLIVESLVIVEIQVRRSDQSCAQSPATFLYAPQRKAGRPAD